MIAKMNMERKVFGQTADGKDVHSFVFSNASGFEVTFINYGAAIVSVKTPDREGQLADVVLGYDDVTGYEQNDSFVGVCVGRYANRISKAAFTIDGEEYRLAANNGANHLHGGNEGFSRRIWNVHDYTDNSVTFHLVSPDGDERYPGNLSVLLTYIVTDDNAIEICYTATTDKPTVCNLTNHSYFNLTGAGGGKHHDHEVMINADRYTVVDGHGIPSGELRHVEGTAMDFRKPFALGARINDTGAVGYDHNWCLNKSDTDELTFAARVVDPNSGRTLECWTTDPGVQLYDGFFLGKIAGKGGTVYDSHEAFCLETQKYPDSPNHPHFPSSLLSPGETYKHTCIYRFGVDE